jgi:raffinose/stachyose/melibiose transport system substrate-binding protein
MKSSKPLAAIMACLMAVVLSACNTATNKTTTDTSSKSGTISGEFSLMVFHTRGESGTNACFYNFYDKFKKENPNVTIDLEYVDHDDYQTKITTLMAGNSLPDVFLAKADMLSSLADDKVIQPIGDEVLADSNESSLYENGAFDDGTYNGKAYTIPFQMQANCIISYNTDILKECGITEFPSTYKELLNDIPKIKDKGYIPIALGNKAKWVAEGALFNTFAYRYVDGTWFSNLKSGNGKAKFTDKAFVSALTDFQALSKSGAFNEDMNSIDDAEMATLYYSGKAAMFIQGAWAVNSIISNCPANVKNVTEFALMPTVDGQIGSRGTVAAGTGWGYCMKTSLEGNDKEAAMALLKCVTTGDYGTMALQQGFFPACKTTGADTSKLDPVFIKYMKQESQMKFLPIFNVQLPAEIITEEQTDLQELLIGTMTPEAMAEKCQNVMESTYNK